MRVRLLSPSIHISIRSGGTSWAAVVARSSGSRPRPPGTTVTLYGASPARLRGKASENEGPSPPAVAVTTALNPGPPWNGDGRVTVISAPRAPREHPIGASHRSSMRPDHVTGASSASPSIHPSGLIESEVSSLATRSGRPLGGDTTAAY